MKSIFIDESKYDTIDQYPLFVVCGLVLEANKYYRIDSELQKIKREFNVENLKELRGNRSQDEKIKSTKMINKILHNYEVEILSAVLGVNYLNFKPVEHENYNLALKLLIERFYLHLKKRKERGLIHFDTIDRTNMRSIREETKKLCMEPHMIVSYKYGLIFENNFSDCIEEYVIFVDDNLSTIIQVADLVASCLHDAFRKLYIKFDRVNDLNDLPKYNNYLKIYWDLFEKNQDTDDVTGYGIKLWR